jgi:lipopolysaccharide transport system permease protein
MFKKLIQKDFWDTVWVFVGRELKIKYAQTYLGVFWMLFPPLMAFLVASFFFGNLLKVSANIPNYSLYAYCGMMAWYYFSYVISFSSVSLVQNQEIIQKSNISRLVFPLAKALTGLIDLSVWIVLLLIMMPIHGISYSISFVYLPLILTLNLIAGLSIGIWIAAFSIKYRDIYQLVPYIIGFTMLVTPVFYHPFMVPEHLRLFLYLNPIAGVIEFYRKIFIHYGQPIMEFLPGFLLSVTLLFFGLVYFFKQEKYMAEQV